MYAGGRKPLKAPVFSIDLQDISVFLSSKTVHDLVISWFGCCGNEIRNIEKIG